MTLDDVSEESTFVLDRAVPTTPAEHIESYKRRLKDIVAQKRAAEACTWDAISVGFQN